MIKFTRGDWVHEDFMDVFIEVVKVQYSDPKRVKLKIHWWVLGWVGKPYRPFPGAAVTLVVQTKDIPRWKRLESRIRTVPESA